MSAATQTYAAPSVRLTGGGIIRSEWIKLRTLRSTVYSFIAVIVISVGLSALITLSSTSFGAWEGEQGAINAASASIQAGVFGIYFGQLVVAVLGVLVISGEYSTGMIRSTLTAVPKRLPALAAKAFVLFLATFVVGLIANILSFAAAIGVFAASNVSIALADPITLLPLVGGALYLALVAVFALGVGTILRSAAGGIAVALGVLLVLPIIVSLLPVEWAPDVADVLLSNAGMSIYTAPFDGEPQYLLKLGITLIWVVVSLGFGAALLKSRDA